MKASWFKKHGFNIADKNGMSVLLWKEFKTGVPKPQWNKKQKNPLATPEKDKVIITGFINGICPIGGINIEKMKKAVKSFRNQVVFNIIDTSEPEALAEWGLSDGIFINNKEITTGPPLTEDGIAKLIKKELKKMK